MLEIERKFLTTNKAAELIKDLPYEDLIQFYPHGSYDRYRSINNEKFIFTKKTGEGLVREELEYEISKEEFEEKLNLEHYKISKRRFFLTKKVTFDLYENGLIILEIEYDSEESAKRIPKQVLPYILKEITNEKTFSNFFFAKNGVPTLK